jgi:hypothetical protein
MAKIAKTHLWMGITSKGKIEFEKYFEIDYSDEGVVFVNFAKILGWNGTMKIFLDCLVHIQKI